MFGTARASVGGMAYHVLGRGNGRTELLHQDDDYAAFLKLLGQASMRLPRRFLSYGLLANRYHQVVWPREHSDLRRSGSQTRRGTRSTSANPSGGEKSCVMTNCTLQPKMTWAEDRATQRCDPGAKTEGRPVFFPKDAAGLPLRDWHPSDKPSRHEAATLRKDATFQLANTKCSEFQFTVNQDTCASWKSRFL